MKQVCKNISWLRKKKGLTQEALAEELCISRGQLGAYEETRNNVPLRVLVSVSDFFNVSIDDLVRKDLSKISE